MINLLRKHCSLNLIVHATSECFWISFGTRLDLFWGSLKPSRGAGGTCWGIPLQIWDSSEKSPTNLKHCTAKVMGGFDGGVHLGTQSPLPVYIYR